MEGIYSESKARDRKLIFEEKEKKGRKKKRKERIRQRKEKEGIRQRGGKKAHEGLDKTKERNETKE